MLLGVGVAHGAPAVAPATDEAAADGVATAGVKRRTALRPTIQFNHLTTGDGLPQSHITAIAQDVVGFMWFGTQEGLARYDGTEFKVFAHRVEGRSELPSSYVTALAADSKGALWIGTDAGLAIYDVKTDRFERPGDAVTGAVPEDRAGPAPPTRIVTALIAGDRWTWVGYNDGRIDRIDASTRAVTTMAAVVTEPVAITALASAGDGSLWIGTAGQGLIRLSAAGQVAARLRAGEGPSSLRSDDVNALLLSRSGSLFIGTELGLARRLPDGTFAHVSGGARNDQLTDERVASLTEDAAGDLWIGTRNGLNRLTAATGALSRFEAERGSAWALSSPWVTSLLAGREGVMWVGTFAGGLDRFDAAAMRFSVVHTGDAATAFLEDREGFVWIGTYPGGLIRLDPRTALADVHTRLPTDDGDAIDLSPHWVTALHQDRHGRIWAGVLGLGLVAFDPRTERAKLYLEEGDGGEASGGVWDIAADERGQLWLATWGAGLVRFDPEQGTSFFYSEADGLPTDLIYSVHTDRRAPGVVWLGTSKEGLVRFDVKSEKAVTYRNEPNDRTTISQNDVLSIDQSADGSLWIGTYGGGFNRFDPGTKTFESFGENLGLTSGTIYGVLSDKKGILWVSTNGGGLARFDPRTRAAVILDSRDGVLTEYGQRAYYLAPSGRFYFGGPQGAVSFKPEEVEIDTTPPPLLMTRFQVYGEDWSLDRPVWFNPPISLDHSETLLTFHVAGMAYASPERIQYEYRLVGVSDRWLELQTPVVTIALPGSGSYTFEARAASRRGAAARSVLAAAIVVAPPPWLTWWAFSLYAGTVVLLVVGFVRLQTRRVAIVQQANRLEAAERDLELSGAVQTGFLPREAHVLNDGIHIKGVYRPAQACGGDWWWHETLPDGVQLVIVGDVTGHGAGPAMVTAAVGSAFREQRRSADSPRLDARLVSLNQEVLTVGRGKYHMTMTALEFDARSGTLRTCSAGGLHPLVLQAGVKPVSVMVRGTPLGWDPFRPGVDVRPLPPGSRVFVATDGIPEIVMPNGRELGMKRISSFLEATRASEVEEVAARLLQMADEANAGKPQADDWTFVLVDWQPAARPGAA